MKTLVALFFAAAVSAADSGGRLFVHMGPGFEVLVDGASIGQTTSEQGGLLMTLVPGPHHVSVRSSDGREGSFDVVITAGETRDVTLSPLGLRRKLATSGEDESASLRVACVPEDCNVRFRESVKEKKGSDELPIDAIPAGRYPLTVSRGLTTLRTDVDLQKGMIVSVEANFTTGTLRVTDSRRRSRRLNVAEAHDALSQLGVPPHWKSAIRSALPAGIYIAEAYLVDGTGVKVTMRVPSEDVGVSLIRSINRSTAFSDVRIPAAPRRDQNAWVLDLIFYFPEGR